MSYHYSRRAFIIGQKFGQLYKLSTVLKEEAYFIGKTTKEESMDRWHRRYGHLGYFNLKCLND